MLTGGELSVAIAAILFAAIGLGAALHWLWLRLGHVRPRHRALVTELIEDLHNTEEKREAAEAALHDLEGRLERREAELGQELAEARADLDAMHGGLIHARQRLMELEKEIERLRRGE